MNNAKLAESHRLIQDYKRGLFKPGTPINRRQIELLKILAIDLDHKPTTGKHDVENWIPDLASLDTQWNRATMKLIDDIYQLREKGQLENATNLIKEFLQNCPSSWYKKIAASA